jgi:hypothetical protein
MRRRWALRGFACAAWLAAAGACTRSEAPPYGFAGAPEQRWRFEAEEIFDVDGTQAKSVRYADLILRAKPEASGDTDLEMFLERYYARTTGTPTGDSEFSLSEKGVTIQTAQSGRVGFGPNDKTLGGDTTLELRSRPAASVELGPNGDVRASIWQSPHPLLLDVAILDWLVFALPTRAPAGAQAWTATRMIPQTGRFSLGLEVPVRWEIAPPAPDAPSALRASAALERSSLRVDPRLEGRLALDLVGSAEPLADGRVRLAQLELRMDFTGSGGEHVVSRHRIRVECTSCAPPVNSPATGSDSAKDREGTSQQGHVDDLPDHGGVRRGL